MCETIRGRRGNREGFCNAPTNIYLYEMKLLEEGMSEWMHAEASLCSQSPLPLPRRAQVDFHCNLSLIKVAGHFAALLHWTHSSVCWSSFTFYHLIHTVLSKKTKSRLKKSWHLVTLKFTLALKVAQIGAAGQSPNQFTKHEEHCIPAVDMHFTAFYGCVTNCRNRRCEDSSQGQFHPPKIFLNCRDNRIVIS